MLVQYDFFLLHASLLRNSSSDSRRGVYFPTKELRKKVLKLLLKVVVCGTTVIFPTIFFQMVEISGTKENQILVLLKFLLVFKPSIVPFQ